MPNILPGVEVTITDKSQIILQAPNLVSFGIIGEFSRGSSKPALISTTDQFKKYFGEYEDISTSFGKSAYISAIQLLKRAPIWVSNVYKSALIGGLGVPVTGPTALSAGVTDNTTFNFTPTITAENKGIAPVDPAQLSITAAYFPLIASSVSITYTKGGNPVIGTDDGLNNIVTADLTATVNYTLGTITGTFSVWPDGGTHIYIKYNYDTQYLFAVMANSPKTWSDNFGIKVTNVEQAAVYNVSMGAITSGSIASIFAPNFPLIKGTVTVSYLKSGVLTTITDDGNGSFIPATDTSVGFVDYNTGEIAITFVPLVPDNLTTVYASYQYYTGNFTISEYQNISNVDTLLNSYLVSRDPAAIDGFGNSIFIEDVFLNKSTYFRAVNNSTIDPVYVPVAGVVVSYLSGGTNGSAITNIDKVSVLQNYYNPSVSFNVFIGGGIIDKTVLDEISNLVTTRNKFAYCDSIADTAQNIVIWANTVLLNANMRMALYTPNVYISYNGKKIYCPASGVVGMKYAETVINGKKYMPPAGVDRGTIDVISLERYYTDTEILSIHQVNLNVIKNISGYGNVIFSDFTMQSKLSSTSFINSVLTLNDMITTFDSNLITINFKLMNDFTLIELRTLIDGYLKRLSQQDGTIEPDYSIQTTLDKDNREIDVTVIFVFQGLVEKIKLNLTYTSNAMFASLA